MIASIYQKLLIIILLFAVPSSVIPQENTGRINYSQLHKDFENLSKAPIKAAAASNITIQREEGIFLLREGTVFECPPVNGNVHALLFTGDGQFTFTPPNQVEQEHLSRFYEKKNLNENFDFVFFLFTDSTYSELKSKLFFTDINSSDSYSSRVKDAMDYLYNDDKYLNSDIIYTFLENNAGSYFYAHFNDSENDPMFFQIDPSSAENVSLMRRYNYEFRDWHEVVCQYSSDRKKTYKELEEKVKDGSVNISKYEIKSVIESDVDFSADAAVTFTPDFESQQCIKMYLYYDLEVDSILWDGSKPAEFHREEESSLLWIIPAEPMQVGESYKLNIFYHGDLLERNQLGWVALKSSTGWYPDCSNLQKSIFDLTFSVHEDYSLCSVGEKISEAEEDEMIISKWVTKTPVRNASFSVGYFDEYKLEEKNLPPVTVYMSKYGHNQVAHALAAAGIGSSGDMEEKLAADVMNCFNMFKTFYGEIPVKEFFVTEIPYYHSGEAFPGLVHISWDAFQGMHYDGEIEELIAHEVSHQWWGIGVDIESYHDTWLGEAFAEYSGLWYMQLVKGNDKFFDALERSKEKIMNNRKYLLDEGQQAGPVWLGYRTSSSRTEGDYGLIIYQKGAWVLHMLRNMLLDLKTMKEDKFQNMMRDYYSSFKDKRANTGDFKKIVEKHFGEKMDWFFNQWVYGTSEPEYTFAYKTEETPEGKFKVRCRVKQENVPDNFKSYVIMLVKFDEERYVRLRVEVSNKVSEFDLPLLPLEPKEIVFNDLHSTLCEVDNEDW